MLSFNKTTEYAFRIMSYMAADTTRLYRSDDIFDELKIPFRYLRRLLTKLSNAGLLVSIQGKYGGFRIIRPLETITLYDIFDATDEKQKPGSCFFGFAQCPAEGNCILHDEWSGVSSKINAVLSKTTLAQLRDSKTDHFILTNTISQSVS